MKLLPSRVLLNITVVCLVISLFGCTASVITDSEHNPMPRSWTAIRREIDDLEENRASSKEWKASAESTELVETESEMNHLIAPLKLAPAEHQVLTKQLLKSSATIHFGFEANYHALVFFERDAAVLVIKW